MLHITIVADPAAGGSGALGGLGQIEIRSGLFQMGSIDQAAVDSHLSIGGHEYVITSVDVKPHGSEQSVTITVAPIERDPFEQTREEKQPEW